jgi:hypothetical protein
MPALAIILLAASIAVFAGSRVLAHILPYPRLGIEYMLFGLGFATLSGCMMAVVLAARADVWRNIGILGLAVWISEGVQMTACRAMVRDIYAVPKDANLCDYIAGWPVSAAMLTFYCIALASIVGLWWAKDGK